MLSELIFINVCVKSYIHMYVYLDFWISFQNNILRYKTINLKIELIETFHKQPCKQMPKDKKTL